MTFAVVGATGAVGRELLSLLAERGIPAGSLRALASERSAGTEVAYGNGRMVVEELAEQSRAVLAGDTPLPEVFAEPCAFNDDRPVAGRVCAAALFLVYRRQRADPDVTTRVSSNKHTR